MALTLAAGLHIAAAYDHREELSSLGFFVATAALQLTSAFTWQARPSPGTRLLVVISTFALIGTWAVSRTAGIALGHAGGGRESIGLLDAVVVAVELVVLLGAITIPLTVRGPRQQRKYPARLWSFFVVVGVSATAAATILPGPSDHHGDQHPGSAALNPSRGGHEPAPHGCYSAGCSAHSHP